MPQSPLLTEFAPLARRTTLQVGGSARYLMDAATPQEVLIALAYAQARDAPVFVLGGGSNVLVSDDGFDGMVLTISDYRISVDTTGSDEVILRAGAGVEWDELVAFAVSENWAGLECLSGIPGRVGAAPIQNIGAYGQEVSETIRQVVALDRESHEVVHHGPDDLQFGYRTSAYKTQWRDRYVVLRVDFALRPGGAPSLRYDELRRWVGVTDDADAPPTLGKVREAVLAIRARKAMVLSDTGPNRRSAGSFFTNPIVSRADAAKLRQAIGEDGESMPAWPTEAEEVKLSAAWLIERAGFTKGYTFGKAGLSSRHALALINRGDARASDLIALASIIRRTVRREFHVELVPEPQFVGFDRDVATLLG